MATCFFLLHTFCNSVFFGKPLFVIIILPQKTDMFIYAIDNLLFVHSFELIRNGKIKIVDHNGETVKQFDIDKKDYISFPLNLPIGKYKVDLSSENENAIKHVFIRNKSQIY